MQMQNNTTIPILEEHDFRDHKKIQLPIIDKYQFFNKRKTEDMIECGRFLQFAQWRHLPTQIDELKLEKMYTCKDRFCPFCNWRRARKLAIQSYDVLKAIQEDKAVRYIFATFTVKNCLISDLSETIKAMNKGFEKMARSVRFKGSILGHSRILEYPPQKGYPDFVHPHFHCLFVVPAIYFDNHYDLYIKQDEWQQLWKKSMRLDYDPSVDVRIIKAKGENDPIAKAVAEFAKYPLKSVDLDPLSVEQFQELTIQMHKKRAVAFGGIIKEYRKKLVLDDVEDGDLIYDDPQGSAEWINICELLFEFKNGEYGLDYYLKK